MPILQLQRLRPEGVKDLSKNAQLVRGRIWTPSLGHLPLGPPGVDTHVGLVQGSQETEPGNKGGKKSESHRKMPPL